MKREKRKGEMEVGMIGGEVEVDGWMLGKI